MIGGLGERERRVPNDRKAKSEQNRHPLLTGCLHVLLNLCNEIPNLRTALRLLETKRIIYTFWLIHTIRVSATDTN